MSNTEWNPRQPGEYARYSVWGEDIHPYDTLGEYDEEVEEEEEEDVDYYSIYEEMFADAIVRDASLIDNAVRLSVSTPTLTVAEGVSMTFKHSDKATIKQEVIDGQLSLTIQENAALESIKIHANNRTWTIPLNAFPALPPSMPKKR